MAHFEVALLSIAQLGVVATATEKEHFFNLYVPVSPYDNTYRNQEQCQSTELQRMRYPTMYRKTWFQERHP